MLCYGEYRTLSTRERSDFGLQVATYLDAHYIHKTFRQKEDLIIHEIRFVIQAIKEAKDSPQAQQIIKEYTHQIF